MRKRSSYHLHGDDIRIEDFDIQPLTDTQDKLVFYAESWFDVEKYYNLNLDEDEWVNVYFDIYVDKNRQLRIRSHFYIDSIQRPSERTFTLSTEERRYILDKCERKCYKEEGMGIREFLSKYNYR